MPIHARVINLIRFIKRACVNILRGFFSCKVKIKTSYSLVGVCFLFPIQSPPCNFGPFHSRRSTTERTMCAKDDGKGGKWKFRSAKTERNSKATILGPRGHGQGKTISKEPVFLGCLFSPPLRQYIFHWLSTKRGRSIFYHKSLWTWSHVYSWTTRTRARALSSQLSQLARLHTRARARAKHLNCLDIRGWSVTSPSWAYALRWEKEKQEDPQLSLRGEEALWRRNRIKEMTTQSAGFPHSLFAAAFCITSKAIREFKEVFFFFLFFKNEFVERRLDGSACSTVQYLFELGAELFIHLIPLQQSNPKVINM